VFVVAVRAAGQQPGPALSIDANAGHHAISPDIYGISYYWDLSSVSDPQRAAAAASDIRATARRWGGNGTSTYHWKFDVSNIANDWFYEVLPDKTVNAAKLPEGSSFNAFADQARISGGKIMGTIPILGWLPKARAEMCSFSVAKYGTQCKQDPYAKYHPITCGNGIVYTSACGDPSVNDGKTPSSPTYVKNDPTDAYAPSDETFQADWVKYAVSRYGWASQGGISIWSLDNEPIWWDSTHRDIHPDPYTYDEVLALDVRYAQAIKPGRPDGAGLRTGRRQLGFAVVFQERHRGGRQPVVDEPGRPQRTRRCRVSAVVPAADAQLRAPAWGKAARLSGSTRVSRAEQRRVLTGRKCCHAGPAAELDARLLGSGVHRVRRLLDPRRG
jgi:hypothetical protein